VGRQLEHLENSNHERLSLRGYRIFNKYEEKVYWHNPQVFDELLDVAFRYACIEAEVLNIETNSEAFKRLCDVRRIDIVSQAWDVMKRFPRGTIIFEMGTEEDMYIDIIRKYN